MSDLAEFLVARIADDEALARYVLTGPSGPYNAEWVEPWSGSVDPGNDGLFSTNDSALSRFIVEHDPARVLAECGAKRKIVKWAMGWPLRPSRPSDEDAILRPLAAVYADHPDFRREWVL